eukprot:CAMPEP_0167798874 /NCGR_PEP_ID=MMETSP0111_2-20121227/16622_1 /TAXON_ID=91324 /ORGANISM="Lotharella globosa, Strain CCCM811" /LENGTH=125 /DNA_ID=CAMNT_0007693479 /DNA_START=96 /DNA_END=473 /DNA_ORIENTATION=+
MISRTRGALRSINGSIIEDRVQNLPVHDRFWTKDGAHGRVLPEPPMQPLHESLSAPPAIPEPIPPEDVIQAVTGLLLALAAALVDTGIPILILGIPIIIILGIPRSRGATPLPLGVGSSRGVPVE